MQGEGEDDEWTDVDGSGDGASNDEDGNAPTIGNGLDEAIDSVCGKHGLNGTLGSLSPWYTLFGWFEQIQRTVHVHG